VRSPCVKTSFEARKRRNLRKDKMGLNKSEASYQIDQMIKFIEQEAKEKADEIETKAKAEFTADKLLLINQFNTECREKYEKLRKERVISKRIERSKKLNDARYQVMLARDEKIKDLKDQVLSKLALVSKNKQYRDLLRSLVVQGLMTLMEEHVTVQCRKEDEGLVSGLLEESVKVFQEIMLRETGVSVPVVVKLSGEYLPSAPTKDGGPSCCGGVVLSARKGQLVCRNTLDSRLDHAFYKLQPQVRGIIFGVREAPKNAWVASKDDPHHH